MSFDYELAYQQVKQYLGRHQDSFIQEINLENDINKRLSFPSEVFFASILQKCIGKKNGLIEQTGENHPDIIMKMNGIRFNFEVTLMTQEDERFRYKSINARENAVTDKPKTQLTSKILDKTRQYERWFKKGIVSKNDVNIIAVDLGDIFPFTPTATLLDAAIFMKSDEYEILNDNYGRKFKIPQSRGHLVKTDCDGRESNIHLDHVYDGLKHIDALLTFTKINIPESSNNFNIININNNENINRLSSLISPHYQTTISRWGILW
ncbi:hypothetical protein EXW94_25790 [Enterobacter sp. JMULE2]|uniref:hypothetical protein n=1 Tax=Enterobacter sp. JMULE2 TaxID=2518340 RepID=UPI001576C9CB|nr:hypothetical protein [Enterobacter sp. JMULE2]NTZ41014.1 hypothetical protein [Enterobacter sp. JMULE2]